MIEVVSEQEARTMQNPYHGSITEDVPVSESELVALAKVLQVEITDLIDPTIPVAVQKDSL